ncbi:lytic murein transglycosylase [Streptomyces sp. NPDC045431]|uniref:lytic transglycosylase domain-containing protein n=1 Tax=Streptomyces sp. NPDC045431 TaxID=3155613 RepID=UPI0033DD7D82
MMALTASQAPGAVASATEESDGRGHVATGPSVTGDSPYRTELPPLRTGKGTAAAPATAAEATSTGGLGGTLPATVLAAYRHAETALASSAPGCGLRWQLLAAIGQVESGQARGGRLTADGTTVRPILGPRLDGNGFALIRDTDGGAYDGDAAYDRAVGPMQFIPSTWAAWGADGNGDGRADPGNIHDAALAAGRYLCAGGRDLTDPADLDRAILGYNHSAAYLRTVRAWYAYFLGGEPVVVAGPAVSTEPSRTPAPEPSRSPAPGRPSAPSKAGPSPVPPKRAEPSGSSEPARPRPTGTREASEAPPTESRLPIPDADAVLPGPPLGNGQDSMPAAPSTIPDTGR